jgi:transposase
VELRREDAERIALGGGEPARELMLRLYDQVADQGDRLERLERRLGQNSVNSSLPPSSDRGQGPKRPARKRSGRKQGGQSGHPGASRELVEDPDETVEHRPERCRRCGHDLGERDRVVGRAVRHQVIDLPASAVVTPSTGGLRSAARGARRTRAPSCPPVSSAARLGPGCARRS